MTDSISEIFKELFDKNNNVAYNALQKLQKECEETNTDIQEAITLIQM